MKARVLGTDFVHETLIYALFILASASASASFLVALFSLLFTCLDQQLNVGWFFLFLIILVCVSNAHEFSVDERADVSWAISVGSDSETPEIRDGSMVFDHDNTNNFQKCCFDFMVSTLTCTLLRNMCFLF